MTGGKEYIEKELAVDALSKHAESVKEAIVEEDHLFVDVLTDGMKRAIRNIPSAPQWIPCSERLPEYMEPVLTWDGCAYCVEKRIPIIRNSDTGEGIPGNWWVSDDYDEHDSDYYPNLRDGACIAWMPLPEPYKGVTE